VKGAEKEGVGQLKQDKGTQPVRFRRNGHTCKVKGWTDKLEQGTSSETNQRIEMKTDVNK